MNLRFFRLQNSWKGTRGWWAIWGDWNKFSDSMWNTVLQVKKKRAGEITGIIIYSSTTWLMPKCPFFPWMENAVDIAYYNETARPLLKITWSGAGYSYEKTLCPAVGKVQKMLLSKKKRRRRKRRGLVRTADVCTYAGWLPLWPQCRLRLKAQFTHLQLEEDI